ncbi:MAG: ABC transporter permease [Clostridia bacterium]|nr:ABC transporter permease [Clostridia bacterium]
MENKLKKIRLPKTGAIYAIILLIIVYSIILKGGYLSLTNVENVLRQSAALCILALCAFLAIMTHQNDLSVGAIASMSGVVLGLLLSKELPLVVAILGALISGFLIGILNGVIAGYTTVPPFVITLATMNIAKSIALVLNNGTLNVNNAVLKAFNATSLWILPLPMLLVLAIYLVFFYILKQRRYGTMLYAVGGKEDAAVTAGINTKWIKMSVYLINGTLSALAGVIYVARLNAANPTQCNGLELEAIAAAVLGGTATSGGQGSVWGAFLGALAMFILKNGMNLMGVRIIEQQLAIGIVLILVLAFDIFNRGRRN